MLQRLAFVCAVVVMTACGSDKSSTSNSAASGATDAGDTLATTGSMSKNAINASKMTQQATTSTQDHADQSETATSGSDDGSGTSKAVEMEQGLGRGGVLGIHPQPGIDFSNPTATDFNVTLAFQSYIGADNAASNGNLDVSVHHGSNGAATIVIEGSVDHSYSNGRDIRQSTAPSITVVKQGTRDLGKVVRSINGAVNRVLTSTTNSSNDFNFLISHASVVTDAYVSGALSNRAISGNTTIVDEISKDSAVVTFTNVVRPAPSACLCPTQGTITAIYTHGSGSTVITHTFNGTCGQVAVAEHASVEAAAAATISAPIATSGPVATSTSTPTTATTAASATATSSASATVTWDFCTPG